MHDVIIVGGGPAGLSAALVLGRACKRVLVIDQGSPRNAHAKHMHGYLSRDGFNPMKLLAIGRDELERYDVEFLQDEVIGGRRIRGGFAVRTHSGKRFTSKKLLLATGIRDQLPRIQGFTELYGISVHHCPYCDGWEWRDKRLAAYGDGKSALGLALSLKNWSDDVLICTDGEHGASKRLLKAIREHQLQLCEEPIARLEGRNGKLHKIVFESGNSIARDAMFFNTGQRQKSSLAENLGCEFDNKDGVVVDKRERTCVPGLFLCGDASKDVQFVVQAAAEGAIAAVTINKEFQEEEGRVL
jgi:thioredoxin reductase